jgi:polyribonucleotide nucleotidyltransferase
MFTITKKSIEWGGRTLTLETGRIARQADASVLVTYGDTSVLCTVVAAKSVKPDMDFFPRRPSDGKRDSDVTSDRPSDPSAVC